MAEPDFNDDPVGYCLAKADWCRSLEVPLEDLAQFWDRSALRWEQNLAIGLTPARRSQLVRSSYLGDLDV